MVSEAGEDPRSVIRDALVGRGERLRLELKGCLDPRDHDQELRLVRAIVGMANALGGHVVVGIRETPRGRELVGIPEDVARQYDTTAISKKVGRYVHPPVDIAVALDDFEGHLCAVVTIEPCREAPHRVCKTGQRTDGTTVLEEGTAPSRTSAGDIERFPDYAAFLQISARAVGSMLVRLRAAGVVTDQMAAAAAKLLSQKRPLPPNVAQLMRQFGHGPVERTASEVLAAVVIYRLLVWGVRPEKLEQLAVWIRDPRALRWAVTLMGHGLGAHLYTDLEGHFEISDDIPDYLAIDEFAWGPHVHIPLTGLINDMLEAIGAERMPRTLVWHSSLGPPQPLVGGGGACQDASSAES